MSRRLFVAACGFVALGFLPASSADFGAVSAAPPDLRSDGVTQFHSPATNADVGNPYAGKIMPHEHVMNKPIYPPMNEKLFKADISRTLSQEGHQLQVHAGAWLNKEPDHIPNLELEPIGYSRQWLGEERMGGGWTSANNPLSVDKKLFLADAMEKASGKMTRASSRSGSPVPADEEEDNKDFVVSKDADGNVHVMPRKR
mmetsp:Transcript_9226/g.18410  ORF Transcript_9226/g.18410 Transcript_9226/m.18410 type:complete len:200 (-) Transcript_9226:215-814(-)|eukprot:CAMPEP_0181317772 /NCGR_PEP_ID=MMETSP1101-20121128/16647_1 /TAXON_ID=46948 /ORGANISM="Rhodomonas abbreviata, Strain Caron Lab Isolate" /LENGTH=199 /DNA_ID=CAMNT_0023425189 /DNA_START=327 /DNA_END=926 /DNA_ORIENTATION=+